MLEKIFKLSDNKTTVRTEIVAGITTFMTMAYILAVNPGMLAATGMSQQSVFVATAISSRESYSVANELDVFTACLFKSVNIC